MNRKISSWGAFGTLLVTALVIGGCQKFLDRKPLTATLEDLNQGGLEGQIYGLYGAIRNGDVAGQAFGGIPWLGINGFRSEDAEKGSSASDGADWGVIYDQFQYVKDHWSNTIYWDQHYVLIGQANTAIQIADSLGLHDPASKTNRGEAYFFRAYAYLDLVRTFGQVPKIDYRVYSAIDAQKPKAPESEIYALIDKDLDSAIAYLPLNWNNASGTSRFPGRLTRGAAQALKARALMHRAISNISPNWSGALSLCQSVISSNQYTLTPSFAKIWTNEGENNFESIFEIQASIGANGADSYTSWYAIAQGVRGSGDWDLGWGWNTPTETLVNAWSNDDPRKNSSILYSGQQDGLYGKTLPDVPTIPRKYWNKKVYPEPSQQTFTGSRQGGWINQRCIRYADVLLMAAEAANEIGGSANNKLAEDYLEMVRARARGGNNAVLPKIVWTSQSQMRTAIQNERRFELALEGDRFFDLVRWGQAITVLGPQGYQNKHRYYPIPQQAIDNSGGKLVQNPDWQ